MNQPLLNKF